VIYQNKLLIYTFWILLLALSPSLLGRPSTDVVYFQNGDRWTCEIKKLEKGYFIVGLSYVDGDVQIDWTNVARIESSQMFVLRDSSGNVYVGQLSMRPDKQAGGDFQIKTGGTTADVPKSRVASIEQTEPSFWHDLHGGLGLGFSYTKGNNQTQYNLDANLAYLRQLWTATVQLQSSFNGSLSAPSNLRNDLSSYAVRTLNRRNYLVLALSDFLRSDEQQLQLRSTVGGAGGKLLKNSERSRLLVLGGVVWTREQYLPAGTTPTFNSAEAVTGLKMEYFRFKTTNYAASVLVYPSLTDPGRLRVDANGSIKYELIHNLYINFSLYLNYDSRPPRPTANSDYGASSSISYSF
jgi:hypothetical protein